MRFLLAHWHCIIPAVGIIAAMFLMRDNKDSEKDDIQNKNTAITQDNYDEF